jgi:hypothetical protein
MPSEGFEELAFFVPQFDSLVPTRRSERLAVGTPSEARNPSAMPCEGFEFLILCVPQFDS